MSKMRLGKVIKKLVKHRKAEICMAAGTILGVASFVSACIQAGKGLNDISKDHAERIAKVRAMDKDDPERGKETLKCYGKTLYRSARLMAGPLALFVASQVSFYAAYNNLNITNAGLAAGLAGLKKEYEAYQERTEKIVGKEVAEKIRYGAETKEIEKTVVDENGEEKVATEIADVVENPDGSDFVKYFAKGNPNWDNSPDMNKFFLDCQQNLANDMLRTNGELTLNEVYEMLGFERTEAGMVMGWLFDKYHPFGENKVEFRKKRVHIPNENGKGYSIGYAIDFNIDGNIYEEKIRRRGLRTFRKR